MQLYFVILIQDFFTGDDDMLQINKYASMIYRSSQAYFDEMLAPYQIGSGQHFFLTHINELPGISPNELAEKGNFDKGTCARAVKKLEDLKYVKRVQRTDDRRSIKLYLTPLGESIIPIIKKVQQDWIDILCQDIQETDVHFVNSILHKMAGNAIVYVNEEGGV